MYQLYNVNQSVQISQYWVRITLCNVAEVWSKTDKKALSFFLSRDAVNIGKKNLIFQVQRNFSIWCHFQQNR